MCGCASRDSSATYAVPGFRCDASITLIPPAGMFGGDTLVHVFPPSCVTCTRPVLVPAQITPAETVESASAWMFPPGDGAARTPLVGSSGFGGGAPSGPVRSGLIVRQVSP